MSLGIYGVGTAHAATSYISSAADAVTTAVDTAGIGAESIGAIINVGAARDLNISEPAIAALIQQAAGIHLAFDPTHTVAPMTFDLLNGGVGVLNALKVVDELVIAGAIGTAVIVAGDVHPSLSPFQRTSFPYSSDVYALVVGPVREGDQIVAVRDPILLDSAEGGRIYADLNQAGSGGRSALTVEPGRYTAKYFDALRSMLREIQRNGASSTTMTVAAPWTADRNADLSIDADAREVNVVNYYAADRKSDFTAAPVAAIAAARTSGACIETMVIPTVPGPEIGVLILTGTSNPAKGN